MARDEILRFTKKYIEKNNIKGNLKIWATGYSRGAAISNMVGGFFAGGGIDYFGDTVRITPEDVYCYTIGTPASIKDGANKNNELSVSANRLQSDYVSDTVNSKEINPNTGDSIMFYILVLGLSILILVGTGIYCKKRKVIRKQV